MNARLTQPLKPGWAGSNSHLPTCSICQVGRMSQGLVFAWPSLGSSSCCLSRYSTSAAPRMQPFPLYPVHTAKLTSHPDLYDRSNLKLNTSVPGLWRCVVDFPLLHPLFHVPHLQLCAILPAPHPFSSNSSSFLIQSNFLALLGPQLLFSRDPRSQLPSSLNCLTQVFPQEFLLTLDTVTGCKAAIEAPAHIVVLRV